VYRQGRRDIGGYLDDYTFLTRGLISLYSATWDTRYLEAGLRLAQTALQRFWDASDGGFFYTPETAPNLVHRPRDPHDAAVPAAGSVGVHNMVLLKAFKKGDDFTNPVERMFELYGAELEANPFALASLVLAHDSYLNGPVEVTVVVPPTETPGVNRPLTCPPSGSGSWHGRMSRTCS